MSKTNKTRPYWVKLAERPMGSCKPFHDHTNGVCDLPDLPTGGQRLGAHCCYWVPTQSFAYSGAARCGCQICTHQIARRIKRRRERKQGRAVTRAARRFANGGWAEDTDDDDL
jgi:hypothetical protein